MKRRYLAGADGVRIAADSFGEPGAELLILLHGGGQSRSAWRGAADALAQAGYHSLSLDLRGHGDSDWAPDGNYAFDRYAADLAAIIDEIGRPAVLVGASLGGHAALMTAATYPDRVRALALADVTPWIDEDDADAIRMLMRSAASGFDTVEDAAAMVDRVRGSGAQRGNPAGLRPHMREGADGRLYWRWDPRFIEDRFVRHCGAGGMLADAARSLAVPVLLMHAEWSTVVDERQIAAFRAELPSIRVERIAGIGHMLTGDDNGAYVPALLRFLQDLES